MIGELAEATATVVTRTEAITARRTFSELKIILGLLLWRNFVLAKLCKEIVPHKLYIFYNKSNILGVKSHLSTGLAGFQQAFCGSSLQSVIFGTRSISRDMARKGTEGATLVEGPIHLPARRIR